MAHGYNPLFAFAMLLSSEINGRSVYLRNSSCGVISGFVYCRLVKEMYPIRIAPTGHHCTHAKQWIQLLPKVMRFVVFGCLAFVVGVALSLSATAMRTGVTASLSLSLLHFPQGTASRSAHSRCKGIFEHTAS